MNAPVLPGLFDVPVAPLVRPVQGASATRRLGQIAASINKATLWAAMLERYQQGPHTDAEMANALGIDRSSVNARRNELVAIGQVEDSGQTRTNARSGVRNVLWRLKA